MRNSTPNWFEAMQQWHWTAKSIARNFAVPTVLARDIQRSFTPYAGCRAIAAAHKELTTQVGH